MPIPRVRGVEESVQQIREALLDAVDAAEQELGSGHMATWRAGWWMCKLDLSNCYWSICLPAQWRHSFKVYVPGEGGGSMDQAAIQMVL